MLDGGGVYRTRRRRLFGPRYQIWVLGVFLESCLEKFRNYLGTTRLDFRILERELDLTLRSIH